MSVLIVNAGFGGEYSGQYLKSYDPEANGGHSEIVWTKNKSDAKRYPSIREAVRDWKRVPKNHPIRSTDGKPNRPLTAFSITFEEEESHVH